MKRFSFNYELAAQASSILYHAQQCAARDQWQAMTKCVDSARTTLDRFLAEDNLVEEPEMGSGYIRASDLPDDDTVDFIRDFLLNYLEDHPNSARADDILNAINFCQELMDDPTFDSVDQLLGNESGSWCSIVWKGKSIK